MKLTHKQAMTIIIESSCLIFKGYEWLVFAKQHPDKIESIKKVSWYALGDLSKESTYDDCVTGTITSDGVAIYLNLCIYDGEMLYGQPEKLRCEYTLKFMELHPIIEKKCVRALNSIAGGIIAREDEEIMRRRIEAAKIAFLAKEE